MMVRVIGSRRELFVDDWLIEELDGAHLKLHPPSLQEVAYEFDAPWEGRGSGYVTVLEHAGSFHMYYRGWPNPRPLGAGDADDCYVCYAQSSDGVRWERPSLGIVELNGSRENNIVWDGRGVKLGTHNFSPFLDPNPDAPADERFKALAGGPLWALCSADGIVWRVMHDSPVLTHGPFDSQNVAFWDATRGCYVAYMRGSARIGPNERVRTIRRSISLDFRHWTLPENIVCHPETEEHLYTNAATPYTRAPHIYFAFPMRFVPGRRGPVAPQSTLPGVSDGVFMTSRDGHTWERKFLEAFIRPGLEPENWTDRNIMTASGMLQTDSRTLSLYWSEHYLHSTARVRRGTMRLDGFASVNSGYSGGSFTTKPLIFDGDDLVINFSTSAVGHIRVEIQDVAGKPIEGFECTDPIYGDAIERRIQWSAGSDVRALAGTPVRLHFTLKDADLYAIQFRRKGSSALKGDSDAF